MKIAIRLPGCHAPTDALAEGAAVDEAAADVLAAVGAKDDDATSNEFGAGTENTGAVTAAAGAADRAATAGADNAAPESSDPPSPPDTPRGETPGRPRTPGAAAARVVLGDGFCA